MTQTRRVLVVMAITTALCADQMAVAAPASAQPRVADVAEMAHRLVTRLSENLRRAIPAALPEPARHARPAVRPTTPVAWQTPLSVRHCPANPFQFRLPPPTA